MEITKKNLLEFMEFYWSFLVMSPNKEDENVIDAWLFSHNDNEQTKVCKCCGHKLPIEYFENNSENCYIC